MSNEHELSSAGLFDFSGVIGALSGRVGSLAAAPSSSAAAARATESAPLQSHCCCCSLEKL